MDTGEGVDYFCLCGRTFHQPGAFAYHKRGCKQSKKRLSGALEKAKEQWGAKKRRRDEATERRRINSSHSETNVGAVHVPVDGTIGLDSAATEVCNSPFVHLTSCC
jgi:hypothetical protein